MAYSSIAYTVGGTPSVAGGTATTLTLLRSDGDSSKHANTAQADVRLRQNLGVIVNAPRVNSRAPNGLTQQHAKLTFRKPKTLANGKLTDIVVVKVDFSFDVEATAAERQEGIDFLVSLGVNADLVSLLKDGKMA